MFGRFIILCPQGAYPLPILKELNELGYETVIEHCDLDELAASLFLRLSGNEGILIFSDETPQKVAEICASAFESFALDEGYQKTEFFDGGLLSGAMFRTSNMMAFAICGCSDSWHGLFQKNVLFNIPTQLLVSEKPKRRHNQQKAAKNPIEKKQKTSKSRPILKVMAALLSVSVFAASGVYLAMLGNEKKEHNKLKNEIAGYYKISGQTDEMPVAENAQADGQELRNEEFLKLTSLNSETVGWINVPNTQIDYPVVQANNNEYYLKHDFKKRFSQYGSIFADANANISADGSSLSVTLFGHNTDDGTMFGELKKYLALSFYKDNPVFTFDTIQKQGKWAVFSVFVATSDIRSSQFFEWRHTHFPDDEQNAKFIDEVKQRSVHNTGIEVLPGEEMVMLTSCSKDFYGARLVIAARRVRVGEQVDTQGAAENPAPLYPTQWYS